MYGVSHARGGWKLKQRVRAEGAHPTHAGYAGFGLGSLVAPLLLGVVTQFAPNYGFYGFYALMAAGLAAFAYTQSIVPEEERSVFVNMPGNTAAMSADLDPRYPNEQSGADAARNSSNEDEAARKTD
ncbi:Uncharacterised protein [Neisseria dentiae]|nr:Uncharacterised protein [Neisseria dentiae]